MNKKIVISVNTAWNVCNFRSGLVRALVRHGYDVIVMAGDDEYSPRLASLGCRFKMLALDNHGTNASHDLALLVKYWRVLQSVRPLVYLGFTVKPNVYGSIAASGLSIPVINNIAGLGAAFIHNSMLTTLVRRLYRLSLRKSSYIFFQNADDRNLFITQGLARESVAKVLPGSGIDLQYFRPIPMLPLDQRSFRFLLISRILKDKGIEEFAAAAQIVHRHNPSVQFQLLGAIDASNPNSISRKRIADWENAGVLQYLDKTDDVRPYLANADCVVLPSYREGVPHSLLEAAAAARPIIASDVAGCKDIVDDNQNGFLCKVKSAGDLAEKMMRMINLSPEERIRMGETGRAKVVRQFDEEIVIATYLHAIQRIEEVGVTKRFPSAAIPAR